MASFESRSITESETEPSRYITKPRIALSNIDRLLEHIRVDPTAEVALRSSQHMDYPELTRATAKYLRRTYLYR